MQQRDDRRYTYGDYRTWPEDVRYELIDGTAWLMSPAPGRLHQEMVGEIFRQAANALTDMPCRAYVAPFDVRLPKGNEIDDDIDTVVQPDVLVVRDRDKLDEAGLRGAPDWVVEVLSPSTAAHDQTRKLAVYERSGVAEVWLVHPTDRMLTRYRLANGGYGRPEIQELEGVSAVAELPEIAIDWDRVTARLED
ncbi:Uma2 family endonuclease [Wenzhouxiangella limi]|uniref:Uma2 family endonuclease n=1 Tax=Wenzhouxiangella limi TaxID=2707351 RepID=A0A845UWW7_9GAMM|nr:Uma2 family endonuclease [Wenzhouxiangella limi]NDY96353.1 Uma2 family endonuclease [Wenzhouxiangella limi]